jgi:cytochrome P450
MRAGTAPDALGPLDPPSLLVVDPPDHTRYRRLVSRVFTPRAVAALAPDVERIATGLLDTFGSTPRTASSTSSRRTPSACRSR